MNLIGPDQKAAVEASIARLRAATGPSQYTAVNQAVVTLVENQHSDAVVRGFTVVQDEPKTAGGGMQGPTPTDLFVSSLGTCENVVFARYAALSDVPVESLETTVTGSWDLRGLYQIGGAWPAFQNIAVETRVKTRASPEKVAEVARQTHRGCPLYASLNQDTVLTFTLFVNGAKVAL